MAILSEIYFKKETLETLVNTLNSKGEKGVSITISVNDEVKEFVRDDGKITQQNASAYVSQSKEDKDNEKKKFYVANGRKVWDNGKIPQSLRVFKDTTQNIAPQGAGTSSDPTDDLPF